MINRVIIILLLFSCEVFAHPGVGIVKDDRGNIFYTDLENVWKISNGKSAILIPGVHTHELWIDVSNNLYGEGGYYDDQSGKFFHYLWKYSAAGQFDTVIGMTEQYVRQNFSLARDKKGNEYYLKRFLSKQADHNRLYRKSPDGTEVVFATGDFETVNWLHPQDDGDLLFASKNIIYRADSSGNITQVYEIPQDSEPGRKEIQIWGIWKDKIGNIYAALFNNATVIRIDSRGRMSTVFTSENNWSPLQGVFDDNNRLWLLENSDQNKVRVTVVNDQMASKENKRDDWFPVYLAVFFLIVTASSLWIWRRRNCTA